jgi:UDP-N-acetylmuramoyl-tripeptide--D-alanyl-D-alanine ligase
MARPDIAIITNIEAVHLEFFASLDAIADAKAEIFQGMRESGTVILNRDNAHFARLAQAAKAHGIKTILSFGQDSKSDAHLIDCAVTSEGCAVNARVQGSVIHYAIGSPGQHLVQNSLAVLLGVSAAGADLDTCANVLGDYKPPQGRGLRSSLAIPGGTITLIDDSFNASPAAVRAAIAVLSQILPLQAGRRVLVLGDMRELGETSPALHAGLAPTIVAAKIDKVFCCGEMMRHLYDALPDDNRGAYAEDSAALAPLVAEAVQPDDVITVKGSKTMKLGYVIEALKALSTSLPQIQVAARAV